VARSSSAKSATKRSSASCAASGKRWRAGLGRPHDRSAGLGRGASHVLDEPPRLTVLDGMIGSRVT
jgi:hypothetical protein